jgi:hypothetical protein
VQDVSVGARIADRPPPLPPAASSVQNATRKAPGRPKKKRRAPVKEGDRRVAYQLPSALAKAADRAGLLLWARLDLDHATLVQADRFYSASAHWGAPRATLLVKNVPPPQRPPLPPVDKAALCQWTHDHVCTRKVTGKDRFFKMADAIYPAVGAEMSAWMYIEPWLRVLSKKRCRLVFISDEVGFGLVALTPFTKGEVVAPGTLHCPRLTTVVWILVGTSPRATRSPPSHHAVTTFATPPYLQGLSTLRVLNSGTVFDSGRTDASGRCVGRQL